MKRFEDYEKLIINAMSSCKTHGIGKRGRWLHHSRDKIYLY